jgi:hypothetical protein
MVDKFADNLRKLKALKLDWEETMHNAFQFSAERLVKN